MSISTYSESYPIGFGAFSQVEYDSPYDNIYIHINDKHISFSVNDVYAITDNWNNTKFIRRIINKTQLDVGFYGNELVIEDGDENSPGYGISWTIDDFYKYVFTLLYIN